MENMKSKLNCICVKLVLSCVIAFGIFASTANAQSTFILSSEELFELVTGDVTVNLVIDGAKQSATNSDQLPGLLFTEGPTWMNGKLYFSSLCFQQDCEGFALVEMEPDGRYNYISHNKMRTNGTMQKGNGNLVVCDMFGHRIIEVSPAGEVIEVIATHMNDGTRLDGPNDLVIDAKGGIYFTDPQYIPGMEKKQPGEAVNYVKPDGEVIRVIEPDEIAFPNGVLLSPDGKTLYVNNSNHNRRNMSMAENYICAYDVNEDGTLSRGRHFAQMILSQRQISSNNKSSGSDGMTIDERGNIYATSNYGMQVFNPEGRLLGIINFPRKPINCCFGGSDNKTMYITSFDKIYAIKMNVKGLDFPLKK